MSERENAVLDRCAKAVHISRLGARRLLEELRPGDPLPGGGVWMPEEPTEAMLLDGRLSLAKCIEEMQADMPPAVHDIYVTFRAGSQTRTNAEIEAIYRAMIRATSEEKP